MFNRNANGVRGRLIDARAHADGVGVKRLFGSAKRNNYAASICSAVKQAIV